MPDSTLTGFLAGIVFAACVFWVGLFIGDELSQKNPNPAQNTGDAAQQGEARWPSPPAATVKENKPAPNGQALCNNPKNNTERDLCQQWRMAEAAEEQADSVETQTWLIGIEVAAIMVALGSAILAAVYTKRSVETSRQEVRGYIRMSHKPSGLVFNHKDRTASMTIQIINSGNTPATITRAVLGVSKVSDGEAFSSRPDYSEVENLEDIEDIQYFHAPGGGYFRDRKFTDIAPKDGTIRIVGFVDYTDVFGKKWRSGYARVVDNDIQQGENNLDFVLEPGWNYDDPRKDDD